LLAFIHGFDGLHHQGRQVVHRARTDAAVQESAFLADLAAIVFQVGREHGAVDRVNRLDKVIQVQFNPTILPLGSTRRAIRGPFDASAAHMLLDLGQILRQFFFSDHGLSPPS
jgi:hypothetical protein